MSGIRIVATGRYVPKKVVQNEDFVKFLDTSDEWITQRTGMKQRHFCAGEPTWLMGALAAKDALEKNGIDPLSIDLIVFTTVTPDYTTPSMACMAQGYIGATNAFCFDINAACSGFVYALDLARRYLACGDVKRVLIVSSEALSRIADFTDRSTCVLFGDAAGACVVEHSEGLFASMACADGTKGGVLYNKVNYLAKSPFLDESLLPAYEEPFVPTTELLHMDGGEVYKFAVTAFPHAIRTACERAGIPVDALDLIVPHQANLRIVKTAAKTLGYPMEKMYCNMDRYANTSSACTAICLDELVEAGRLKPGDKIGVVGFGGGVTYGACVFEW